MISSLRNIFRRPSQSRSRDVSSRVDYSDFMRKKKREDAHSKFRRLIPKCENTEHDKRVAKDLIKALQNVKCQSSQLEASKKIRELSIDNCLMVDYSIKLGLLEAIREKLLIQSSSHELQNEGVWICANISIENAEDIIAAKIHVPLMKMMITPELTEGCLWALTNLCSDSKEVRDELLAEGILFHITNVCYSKVSLKIHQQISSILLNFSKFSGLSKEHVLQLLGLINKYLDSDDFESVNNSLCAVTFLVLEEENIKAIMCAGTITSLIRVLHFKNAACERMAANLLKKLAFAIDENTFIDILILMPGALREQRAKTISDILQFITTIAESDDSELWKKIIDSEELLVKIIEFVKDGNVSVVESSLELIYELVVRAKYDDIKRLVNKGFLESLCKIITENQKPDVLKISLEILGKMLDKAEGYLNYMEFLVEECGGKKNLDFLTLHYDQFIADLAIDIISKYLRDPDENESFVPLSMSPVDISFISDIPREYSF